jgi:hypothetical protein
MNTTKKNIKMTPTIEDYAVSIIKEEGSPVDYREITRRILEMKPLESKRPTNTVYTILLRSNKLVKVSSGKFDLVERAKQGD